jgi:PilZ domain
MDKVMRDWLERPPRRTARLDAEVLWPDGSSVAVVVSNVSYQGCRLSSNHEFVRGETVRLRLPNRGMIHAQIRWIRNGVVGARFLTGDSAREARRARIGV